MAGPSKRQLFGEIAIGQGLLSQDQLDEALKRQQELKADGVKKTLGAVCHDLGFLSLVQINAIMEEVAAERRRGSIEGYKILSKLGKGGMGSVYLARQLSLNKLVAIKILPPRLAQNEEDLARFKREALATASLNHRNIVHAYDVGESNGYNYLVMEYVEGETVKEILDREGRIDEARAADILEQLADALRHAHQNGIVHRDIKPSNIVITRPEGTPKLLDLGLAISKREDFAITKTGVIMGTPYYLSPEQARSEETDTRSDMYSLGITLYHMLVGEPPFTGESAAVIVSKHLMEPLPDPLEKVPGLSNGICFILSKMTAKEPPDRYQVPDELLGDIRELKQLSRLRGKEYTGPAPVAAARTPEPARAPLARVGLIALAAGVPSALLVGLTALDPEMWSRAAARLGGGGGGLTIEQVATQAAAESEVRAERAFAEAEAYASKHADDADGVRARFAVIAREHGVASPIGRKAAARVESMDVRIHQDAQQSFIELCRKAFELRAEGKFDAARETMRTFPTRFARTPWWSQHEREIELIDAAEAASRASAPSGTAVPGSS
jgi:serine/threonine-protein kinase